MNILLDQLPDYVESDGQQFEIRTDFRIWIRFDLLIAGGMLTPEKLVEILKLCYDLEKTNPLPQTAEKAMLALSEFYAGKKLQGEKETVATQRQKRIYSFAEDAEYIYAAFLSQYNINLNRIRYLHWWEFKALFQGLDDTHKFSKIMEYRAMDLSKVKDKEEKRFYRQMKQLYALPDNRTEEEKEADMLSVLAGII